jgi:uncharacterized membrane protein YcaP (DUF421 family)
MWQLQLPAWELAARSGAMYLAVLVVLRLFGKREVGQFTLIDLVLIFLLANAVQPAMTGPDTSLTGGLVIIVTLVTLNRVIALARAKVPFVARLVESPPTELARDGAWIPDALKREEVSVDDVTMAIREHGLNDVSEVKLAVLEGDGTISVVPFDLDKAQQHRRRRARIVRRI